MLRSPVDVPTRPTVRLDGRYHSLLNLVLVAPFAALIAILFRTSLPFPLHDDFGASLGFLLRQQALHGFTAKLLGLLADQQADYKFLFFHVAILAQRALTGSISFALLGVVGNLLFLPLMYSLIANAFPNLSGRNRRVLFIPVVYFACQLTYAEVFNWALASFNCLAVVSFAALALHLLVRAVVTRAPHLLASACLSFVISCASSTNGLLLAPVGVLLFLRAKQRTAALIWSCSVGVSLALYLYRLEPVPHTICRLSTQLLFLLSFLGGSIENMHRWPLPGAAIALGIVLLLIFGDAVRTGYQRRNPFFFWIAAWTLATSVVVARYRSSFGLSQSLSGRYKLYSVLMIVFAYVYLADRSLEYRSLSGRVRRTVFVGVLALSVGFCVAADVAGARFLARRGQWVELGMREYLGDPLHRWPIPQPSPELLPEAEFERQILSAAIADGIYTPRLPPTRTR